MDALAARRRGRADRRFEGLEGRRQAVPGRRGLERVGPVAGLPQRVAQVRRAEPGPRPGPARAPGTPVPPWARTIDRASLRGRLGGPLAAGDADQEQRPVVGLAARRGGTRRARGPGAPGRRTRAASGARRASTAGGPTGRSAPGRAPARRRARRPSRGARRRRGGRPRGAGIVRSVTSVRIPSRPSEPEDELAEVRAGRRGGERRHGQRCRQAPRACRPANSCSIRPAPWLRRPEPRAATQPPTVASSHDWGSWPIVRPRSPRWAASSGPAMPAPAVTRPLPLVQGRHPVEPGEVDGKDRVGVGPDGDAADDARAAAVGDEAGAGAPGEVEHGPDVVGRSWAGRRHPGRRPAGPPGARPGRGTTGRGRAGRAARGPCRAGDPRGPARREGGTAATTSSRGARSRGRRRRAPAARAEATAAGRGRTRVSSASSPQPFQRRIGSIVPDARIVSGPAAIGRCRGQRASTVDECPASNRHGHPGPFSPPRSPRRLVAPRHGTPAPPP